MREFYYCGVICMHLTRLQEIATSWETLELEGMLEEADHSELDTVVGDLMEGLQSTGWSASRIALTTTKQWLKNKTCRYQAAPSEIRHVIEAIQQEMAEQEFFILARNRSQYFDRKDLFGEEVAKSFPDANDDIKEAGSCLAAGRNTAAVFHLMRVVEWGLRGLCASVGFNRIRQTTKSGNVKYVPIAYSEWEGLLNQLPAKIDAKIAKLKRGPKKQAAQTHYYTVIQDIQGIRDAFRNHLMHTRASYSAIEADQILGYVKRIMTTLAGGIVAKSAASQVPSRLIIHSAQWGIGGPDYHDVTQTLRGYLDSGTRVRAAINFFADRYPRQHKHLLVKFSLPGDAKNIRLHTFKEGDLVKFKK